MSETAWQTLMDSDGDWCFWRENTWQDYLQAPHHTVEIVHIQDMREYGDDIHGRESGCIHVEGGELDVIEWNAEAWLDDKQRETIESMVASTGMNADADTTLPEGVAQWFIDRRNQIVWTAALTNADASADLAALEESRQTALAWVTLCKRPEWLAWEMDRYRGICDEPVLCWHLSVGAAMEYEDVPRAALHDMTDYDFTPKGWGEECNWTFAHSYPRERHARYVAADLMTRIADYTRDPFPSDEKHIAEETKHLAGVISDIENVEYDDAPEWYGDGTPQPSWLDLTDERRAEIAEAAYAEAERAGLADTAL